ncbi:hypothetical protein CO709_27760 [Burkholderia thailandensis]|nr:hypothetical protein CO709_27760 [Burkholderia thailandensis]
MHAHACGARAGDDREGSLPDGWRVRDMAARMSGIARRHAAGGDARRCCGAPLPELAVRGK